MKSTLQLLTESWQILAKNWKTYLKIFLYSRLFYFPAIIICGLLVLILSFIHRPDLNPDNYLAKGIVLGIPAAIFVIFITLIETCYTIATFIFLSSPESYPGLTELYKKSLRYFTPFVLLTSLESIIILSGLILFIIPGLILYIWLSFSHFMLLFENKTGYSAIDASTQIVRARFWDITKRLLAISFLYLALTFIPQLLKSDVIELIFGIFSFLIFTPLSVIYSVVLYKNARELHTAPLTEPTQHSKITLLAIPVFALLLIGGFVAAFIFLSKAVPSDSYKSYPEPTSTAPQVVIEPTLRPTTPIMEDYWDPDCSFSLKFDGQITQDWSKGYKTVTFTSNESPLKTIEVSCREEIPKPQVPPENIHQIKLDGQIGALYETETVEGGRTHYTIIIKHVDKDFEIGITGFGDFFHQQLPGFGFIWG